MTADIRITSGGCWTRMAVDEIARVYADLVAEERRATNRYGTATGPIVKRTQFAVANFAAVLTTLVATAEELARLKADRCVCGESDCDYYACSYRLCRAGGEHHRPHECAVDRQGRSLAPCGCPWMTSASDCPHGRS